MKMRDLSRLLPSLALVVTTLHVGCVMNRVGEATHRVDTVEVGVSLNAGPVAQQARLAVRLSGVPGFGSGRPVSISFPEADVRRFLREEASPAAITPGQNVTLALNGPRAFALRIQRAKPGEQAYALDKHGALTVRLPYVLLQRIALEVQVQGTSVNVPAPMDTRTSAQVDLVNMPEILTVENPRARFGNRQ